MTNANDKAALDRLRWNVTLWYVATFGAILIAFGVGLFFAISHNFGIKLDRSLQRAASEIAQQVQPARSDSQLGASTRALRIPDRMLYLFDSAGGPRYPDTASAPVRAAAARAAVIGSSAAQVDIGHEHTLRIHATRVQTALGPFVAVAAADTEELEDEYANLITMFAGALFAALVAVGAGGYVLARRATRPVESSMGRMRRFMADAAHELRTPVSFLCARTEVALQQPRDAAEYLDVLRELDTEANRLGLIVNDLFTLARADAGERRVAKEPLCLDDVVLEAACEARTRAALKNIRLDIQTIDETPVTGDARLLRQLMLIIIENAIKYTEPGGLVTLRVERRLDRAVVTIKDTGIGIPQCELPRIYDRFYRADAARRAADGAGLGLSIAQWIAELHDARLAVTSEVGRGTTVEISAPSTRAARFEAAGPPDTVTAVTVA